MDFLCLIKKIEELYEEIINIEEEKRNILLSQNMIKEDEIIGQELLDYSHIYEELKRILLPMQEYYKRIFLTKYSNMAKKVYFVAICEMVKQDYSRGMLITFRKVTGKIDIDQNRYYDLLQKVSDSQNMNVIVRNNRRMFERSYILETGVPIDLTKDVIKMFKIYWRYFRLFNKDERLRLIKEYLEGNEFENEYILSNKDANEFEDCRSRLKDFPEKTWRVFNKLDLIFTELDKYSLTTEDPRKVIEELNEKIGFDITLILRNSELESIYHAYLQQMPIARFKKVLSNLPKAEKIILPDQTIKPVDRIRERNINCGIYKVRGIEYMVLIDPMISLDEMLDAPCNQLIEKSKDYYMYTSDDYFDVEIDGNTVNPRELYYKNRNKYVWLGRVSAASVIYVDGIKIESSEKIKFSGKIKKYYDAERNQSRIQYQITNFKCCFPEYRFKKLQYSLNDSERFLLGVGNDQGVFYRDNIRVELHSGSIHNLKFWIEDQLVLEEKIVLEDQILFDKWNGNRCFHNKMNTKHSGAFIVFIRDHKLVDLDYDIISSYRWNDYDVLEFNAQRELDHIEIGGLEYCFDKQTAPYFYMWNEKENIDIVDDISGIYFLTKNLSETSLYWFQLENDYGTWRKQVYNGRYSLNELFDESYKLSGGKWTCSLWEKQRKLDEECFILVPQLEVRQKEFIVLEGNDVIVEVTASDNCFISEFGEYCNYTQIKLGAACLDMDGSHVNSRKLEGYVYLDKYGVVRSVSVEPLAWGVRFREYDTDIWKQESLSIVSPEKPYHTIGYVFSPIHTNLQVNGCNMDIVPGFNNLHWTKSVSKIKNKTELIISDGKYSYKQVFACNPQYTMWGLSAKENVVITIRYTGPVDEELVIRCFVEDKLIKTESREAKKNKFLLHVVIGKTIDLANRKITVDICNARAGIPTNVYNGILDIQIPESEIKVRKRPEDNCEITLDSICEYTDVEVLIKRYFLKQPLTLKGKMLKN